MSALDGCHSQFSCCFQKGLQFHPSCKHTMRNNVTDVFFFEGLISAGLAGRAFRTRVPEFSVTMVLISRSRHDLEIQRMNMFFSYSFILSASLSLSVHLSVFCLCPSVSLSVYVSVCVSNVRVAVCDRGAQPLSEGCLSHCSCVV